jgi:hypothetical protein
VPYTKEQKLAEIAREIAFRRNVYAKKVRQGEMSQQESDQRIGIMLEIAVDYGGHADGRAPSKQNAFDLALPEQLNDDWPKDYLDNFWSAYPPKGRVGKVAVARKLGVIRRGKTVTFVRLIGSVTRYAMAKHGSNYVLNAMTWLNQGRWEDHAAAAEASPTNGLTGMAAAFMGSMGGGGDDGGGGGDDDHCVDHGHVR